MCSWGSLRIIKGESVCFIIQLNLLRVIAVSPPALTFLRLDSLCNKAVIFIYVVLLMNPVLSHSNFTFFLQLKCSFLLLFLITLSHSNQSLSCIGHRNCSNSVLKKILNQFEKILVRIENYLNEKLYDCKQLFRNNLMVHRITKEVSQNSSVPQIPLTALITIALKGR